MTAINYVRNVGGGGVVAHGHRSLVPPLTGVEVWPRLGPTGLALAFAHIAAELPNFACNSPATLSNHEFTTLELQRFQTLLKFRPIELHASFLSSGHVVARECRGSFALNRFARARVGLKPLSPLRAGEVDQLKPASPLRARHGCFWCVFWLQRCCRFQRLLFRGEQRCLGFQISGDCRLQRRHRFHMPVARTVGWAACGPTGVPGAGGPAREARRPHFVRCRTSKPARALRSLRSPSHQWGRGPSHAVAMRASASSQPRRCTRRSPPR